MVVTAAKVGVASTASVFISLVSVLISLVSEFILPVVNFIPSASDVILPVMPLKMISWLETEFSRLDIIVADTEITISCLAIILKGLSTDLRMVGVGTNKNSLPLGLASCAVLTPVERVTYFTNNAMSLSVATDE